MERLDAITPFIQNLREALWLRSGLASVMVGSGFSKNSDPAVSHAREFPLWYELVSGMAERIGLDFRKKPLDPLRIAQMYKETFGNVELHRYIEEMVPDRDWSPSDFHRRLLSLPWADVFTTNYDTLLERSTKEILGRNYQLITKPSEISMRSSPRLIKLHGTIGAGMDLISTEEDYRRYPNTHAPFVNFVKQSIMETVFVLIGFAGDDPNFLAWIGWVRDTLGENAPKIYLCGLLNSSPAMQALLSSRGVIPIDLTPVVIEETDSDRHAAAIDWFLAALENGKPVRPINWAPSAPSTAKERKPSLPPTRLFTPFRGYPHTNSTLSDFEEAATVWRAQRIEYPGWHVAPNDVRSNLEHSSQVWGEEFFRRSREFPLKSRLRIAREICWRWDTCLLSPSVEQSTKISDWLEEMGGWDVTTHDSAEQKECKLELAMVVLRTYREQSDRTNFTKWKARIEKQAGKDNAFLSMTRYEQVLLELSLMDLVAFKACLDEWQMKASLPLEFSRMAALYAELGDMEKSKKLAMEALNLIRRGARNPRSISMEAWLVLLMEVLQSGLRVERTDEWRESLIINQEQGYDPWAIIESLRGGLSLPLKRLSNRQRKPGFDLGDIRETTSFGSYNPEVRKSFQLLRLIEKAPCPLFVEQMGVVGDSAGTAAALISEDRPSWALSVIMRTNARKEVLAEVFDRITIACLDSNQLKAAYTQLLENVSQIFKNAVDGTAHNLIVHRNLKSALEILSRLAIRLNIEDLNELLSRATAWMERPISRNHNDIAKVLGRLFKRIIEAYPQEALWQPVNRLLETPMFGEPGIIFDMEDREWPEIFSSLLKYTPPLTANKNSRWITDWKRIISGLRSLNPALRNRAFYRGFFLFLSDWLEPEEHEEFADAVWHHTNETSPLPGFESFQESVALDLPRKKNRKIEDLVKKSLLNRHLVRIKDEKGAISGFSGQGTTDWLDELGSVFCHISCELGKKRSIDLSPAEAENLGNTLIVWWAENRKTLEDLAGKEFHFGIIDPSRMVSKYLRVFGQAILPVLPQGHELGRKVVAIVSDAHLWGYDIHLVTPGYLYHEPSQAEVLEQHFEEGLLSQSRNLVRSSAMGVLYWVRGHKNLGLIEIPSTLIELLISRFLLEAKPGLAYITGVIRELVREAPQTLNEEARRRLLIRMSIILRSTHPKELQNKLQEAEIDRNDVVEALTVRAEVAKLAKCMATDIYIDPSNFPSAIKAWRDQCILDPLPETRASAF